MSYRNGANDEHTEIKSTRAVGGMGPASGGLPEQWAVGRSRVSGKWDSGIHLFLLAEEGVSGTERSPEGDLCRGANHGAFPAFRAYCSRMEVSGVRIQVYEGAD